MLSGCGMKSAGSYYQSGNRYFKDGNYEEAAKKFEAALTLNSHRADYYINYGITLIALERYEEAIQQFDLAYIEKDIKIVRQNNKRIHRGKGIAYYLGGMYEEAIEQFDLALKVNELSSLNMDILYYMGSSQMIIGQYQEAIATYTLVIEKQPDHADAYVNRAYIYRKSGDYDLSVKDYDKAIQMKPKSYGYYFNKYYMLLEAKQELEAQQVLVEAEKIEVDTKEDKYNVGILHYLQGNYDTALAELSDSYANGFYDAYYYIGEIYEVKKDYSTALYYFEKYLEEGKIITPAVYNKIGICYMRMGEYKKALTFLEKGLECSDVVVTKMIKRNIIIAYEKQGMFDIALEKIKEYRAAYPEDVNADREEIFLRTRVN